MTRVRDSSENGRTVCLELDSPVQQALTVERPVACWQAGSPGNPTSDFDWDLTL